MRKENAKILWLASDYPTKAKIIRAVSPKQSLRMVFVLCSAFVFVFAQPEKSYLLNSLKRSPWVTTCPWSVWAAPPPPHSTSHSSITAWCLSYAGFVFLKSRNWLSLFFSFCLLCFKTKALLCIPGRLQINTKWFSCFSLLTARITGVNHQDQLT